MITSKEITRNRKRPLSCPKGGTSTSTLWGLPGDCRMRARPQSALNARRPCVLCWGVTCAGLVIEGWSLRCLSGGICRPPLAPLGANGRKPGFPCSQKTKCDRSRIDPLTPCPCGAPGSYRRMPMGVKGRPISATICRPRAQPMLDGISEPQILSTTAAS